MPAVGLCLPNSYKQRSLSTSPGRQGPELTLVGSVVLTGLHVVHSLFIGGICMKAAGYNSLHLSTKATALFPGAAFYKQASLKEHVLQLSCCSHFNAALRCGACRKRTGNCFSEGCSKPFCELLLE